uniref:Uncharacterized protein n=1 Tax=Romanomermis culicivorax TaxID=13658 RepID=A0A915K498_ROMCU
MTDVSGQRISGRVGSSSKNTESGQRPLTSDRPGTRARRSDHGIVVPGSVLPNWKAKIGQRTRDLAIPGGLVAAEGE